MAVRITRHVYPADFETAEFMFQSFPPPPCHGWYVEINHLASATIETYPPQAEVTQKHAQ